MKFKNKVGITGGGDMEYGAAKCGMLGLTKSVAVFGAPPNRPPVFLFFFPRTSFGISTHCPADSTSRGGR